MSEGKGYAVIAKLNTKPTAQYAVGNSVIYQGDTVDEVATLIGASLGLGPEQGLTILQGIGNTALAQAAEVALAGNVKPDVVVPFPHQKVVATAADTPASPALLAVVASKTGTTVDQLGALTTSQAKQKLAIAASKKEA